MISAEFHSHAMALHCPIGVFAKRKAGIQALSTKVVPREQKLVLRATANEMQLNSERDFEFRLWSILAKSPRVLSR
jgi:hypothetical protein